MRLEGFIRESNRIEGLHHYAAMWQEEEKV